MLALVVALVALVPLPLPLPRGIRRVLGLRTPPLHRRAALKEHDWEDTVLGNLTSGVAGDACDSGVF
jgi:hypothetical protein